MTEQLEVLRKVAEGLEALGIPYMLSGSLAMTYYAEPRMTRDIDLVVQVSNDDAPALCHQFGDAFYVDDEMILEAVRHRGMFNMIHLATMHKVDCIVRKDDPYRLTEFERRRRVEVQGLDIWLVSPEDLLLSKLAWARDSRSERQLSDIRNLLDSVPLDWPYVEKWATTLSVRELLQEVRREGHLP